MARAVAPHKCFALSLSIPKYELKSLLIVFKIRTDYVKQLIHNPPYADWACCMTVGSTSAWDSALRIFCEKDDYIIVDKYSFSSALETAWALGIKTLPLAMDDEGLLPGDLDNILSKWIPEERNARKPFLLYMVPTGQNPTGATQSLERRRQIYAIAQKHNLYIVEDEPYYYLQLPHFSSDQCFSANPKSCELILSYLGLDVDGRVLRLDSLSKVLAPGSRLGWITASEQVVEKFIRLNESSSQHPSGFSQAIIYRLLNHHWGHSGFFQWLENIQSEYVWRRDTFLQACDKYLPKDVASWVPSHAGMFVSAFTPSLDITVNSSQSNGLRFNGSLILCTSLVLGIRRSNKRFLQPLLNTKSS